MMLDAAAKFDVVFMRLKETNPRYLSYFEVDSKGKKKLRSSCFRRFGKS
jgi:hypothetical protein